MKDIHVCNCMAINDDRRTQPLVAKFLTTNLIYSTNMIAVSIFGSGCAHSGRQWLVLTTTQTSVDVLPSKNQALCEYCTHSNKLKHC